MRNPVIMFCMIALALLISIGIASRSHSQVLFSTVSTPDLAVSGTATADYVLNVNRPVDWLYIKNDCSVKLYFGFNNRNGYPIRLDSSQDIIIPFKVTSVSASNPTSTACTFTAIGGRR